jgi:hypothetical protein
MWTDRKTRDLNYRFTDTREPRTNRKLMNGFVQQVVLAYRPGGATAYFKDMRDSLIRCAAVSVNSENSWQQGIVAEGLGGDESVLWRRVWRTELPGYQPDFSTSLVVAVRIREIVILLEFVSLVDKGPVNRAHVDRILKAAINRAAVLDHP